MRRLALAAAVLVLIGVAGVGVLVVRGAASPEITPADFPGLSGKERTALMRCQFDQLVDQVGNRQAIDEITRLNARQIWNEESPPQIALMKQRGISCTFREIDHYTAKGA